MSSPWVVGRGKDQVTGFYRVEDETADGVDPLQDEGGYAQTPCLHQMYYAEASVLARLKRSSTGVSLDAIPSENNVKPKSTGYQGWLFPFLLGGALKHSYGNVQVPVAHKL